MKKITVAAIAGIFALGLVGCEQRIETEKKPDEMGSTMTKEMPTSTTTTTTTTPSTEPGAGAIETKPNVEITTPAPADETKPADTTRTTP